MINYQFYKIVVFLSWFTVSNSFAQTKVIKITGTRFCYPLVQKWIDDYAKVAPLVQIIIESRGSVDPAQYDLLIEAYQQPEEIKNAREYIHIARYAVLPVANSKSVFAKIYADKGINREMISQLFFHDLYTDRKEENVKVPYTIYTRLQKAGAPIVFTNYFGFQQKDIRGKAIAGSDEHLLKAVLRDFIAVSYLPLNLIYDHENGKPISGLAILPVDFNGNGKISDDEKFYSELSSVINSLESKDLKGIHNIATDYIHLSIGKQDAKPEVIEFLRWVAVNGQNDLHAFGFIAPEAGLLQREKLELDSKHIKQ